MRQKLTTEQKVEWLKNSNAEDLLQQFETTVSHMRDALNWCQKWDYTVEELNEDYRLCKAEMRRRMGK